MSIDVSQYSDAEIAAIVAHAQQQESVRRDLARAQRTLTRSWLGQFVSVLVKGSAPGMPKQETFKSGAVGFSAGGKDIAVTLPDGTTRKARVSLLIRWEDTIPASDTKE